MIHQKPIVIQSPILPPNTASSLNIQPSTTRNYRHSAAGDGVYLDPLSLVYIKYRHSAAGDVVYLDPLLLVYMKYRHSAAGDGVYLDSLILV